MSHTLVNQKSEKSEILKGRSEAQVGVKEWEKQNNKQSSCCSDDVE